jgi:lipopolysaccharide transport system permease protein
VFFRQVRLLTRSSLKIRYRKTFAGFLWVILNPLILYGAQSLVFHKFLRLDVPNYFTFLLSGLLPWIFISQTLDMCTSMFQTSGPLLKAFPAHPLVYLMSQIVDNFINFVAAFLILLIPLCIQNPESARGLIFVPLAFFVLGIGVLGMAWCLATAQVFWGDTRYIITFVMSVAFFLTPVFYPEEFIPPALRWIVLVNPFYYLIMPFRHAVYDFNLAAFATSLGKALLIASFAMTLAFSFWKKKKNEFYFYV